MVSQSCFHSWLPEAWRFSNLVRVPNFRGWFFEMVSTHFCGMILMWLNRFAKVSSIMLVRVVRGIEIDNLCPNGLVALSLFNITIMASLPVICLLDYTIWDKADRKTMICCRGIMLLCSSCKLYHLMLHIRPVLFNYNPFSMEVAIHSISACRVVLHIRGQAVKQREGRMWAAPPSDI